MSGDTHRAIAPDDIATALDTLDAAGIKGSDGETTLRTFLARHPTNIRDAFPGWTAVADSIPDDFTAMAGTYGQDAVRAAVVIRTRLGSKR